MGKLLVGHYGENPEAESVNITLRDCHQRLGLKPSDFVSDEIPSFFRHARGAKGKYLVFEVDKKEIGSDVIWRPGYYLLPLEAKDVLRLLNKDFATERPASTRPVTLQFKQEPPKEVLDRAQQWAETSQPLFFHCHCETLILRLDAPWVIRRRWNARLLCKKRCQPALQTQI